MTPQAAIKAKELVDLRGSQAAIYYAEHVQELHYNQKDLAESSFWGEVVKAIKSEE